MNVPNSNPYSKYKEQSVMAATPGELTLMLYDGCIRFLKLSQLNMASSNLQAAHNNLVKASDIITELMNTLDMNYSISGQLLNLYLFIFGEITHANIQKNPDKLNPIIEIIEELRDAWKKAVQIDRYDRFEGGLSNEG